MSDATPAPAVGEDEIVGHVGIVHAGRKTAPSPA